MNATPKCKAQKRGHRTAKGEEECPSCGVGMSGSAKGALPPPSAPKPAENSSLPRWEQSDSTTLPMMMCHNVGFMVEDLGKAKRGEVGSLWTGTSFEECDFPHGVRSSSNDHASGGETISLYACEASGESSLGGKSVAERSRFEALTEVSGDATVSDCQVTKGKRLVAHNRAFIDGISMPRGSRVILNDASSMRITSGEGARSVLMCADTAMVEIETNFGGVVLPSDKSTQEFFQDRKDVIVLNPEDTSNVMVNAALALVPYTRREASDPLRVDVRNRAVLDYIAESRDDATPYELTDDEVFVAVTMFSNPEF